MSALTQTVALFPGQGSQFSGMGKALYQDFQEARLVFEEASEAIKTDLKKLCFDGSDSDLALTANTQPVILTHSIAAFRAVSKNYDFQPKIAAGHSLGEYSALVANGALTLSDAVRMVRFRGEAMQRAVPAGEGSMLALMGIDDAILETLCKRASETAGSVVSPANFNSDAQTVIAGSTGALAQFQTLLKNTPECSRVKAIPLQVSAPFHCALMKKAQDEMKGHFQNANAAQKLRDPAFSYVPNATGRAHQEASAVIDLLIRQIVEPVLWKQSIRHMMDQGHALAIEFGPGKVLQGLSKRIAHPSEKTLSVASVGDTETLKLLETNRSS